MKILRQLRRNKGLNQSGLAKAIGVSLRTIQLYEKRGANIPMKNLTKIADFFDLSIADLYFQELNEPNQRYSKKKSFMAHGNLFHSLPNGQTIVRVPLCTAFGHRAFISDFIVGSYTKGRIQMDFLIDHLDEAPYVGFEIAGDAMDDGTIAAIPHGSVVLGKGMDKDQFIQEEKLLGKTFVMLLKDRIICKVITGFSNERVTLICHSLNPAPEHQDFEIAMSDVLGLYEVVRKQL
ncbi:MAG: helix-turn-helix transcriptional regulator [Bacteroidota bacterium]